MSKVKRIIFILIMSIFILLIKDNTCQAMAQELLGQKENAIGKTIYSGGSELYNSWGNFGNVYCARQDLELENGQNYYCDVVYYIEIKGNEAKFCNKGNFTLRPTSDSGNYRWGQLANILAKQVTTNGGYRTNAGCTDTQYALWYFLGTENSWIARHFGGSWAINSGYFTRARWQKTIELGKNNSNKCANLAKTGTGYKGTVRIYWIEAQNQEKNQSLMIVELEDQEESPEMLLIDKQESEDKSDMGGVGFKIKNNTSGMYIKKADTVEETGSNEAERLAYEVGDIDTNNTEYWTSKESEAMTFTTGTKEEYKGLEIRGVPGGNYTAIEVSNPYINYQGNVTKTFTLETTTYDDYENVNIILNERDENAPGNVKISGTVWEDLFTGKSNDNNSKKDSNEKGVEGIEVYWKGTDGSIIASTVTDELGKYSMSANIDLRFCEWYIDQKTYDKINNSYIEFKYNGLKYTTVAYSSDGAENTSRAMENAKSRSSLDNSFAEISKQGVSTAGARLSYTYSNDNPRKATLSSPVGITNFGVTADTSIPLKSIGLLEDYSATETGSQSGCISHHYTSCEKHGSHHVCDERGSKVVEWDIKNINLGIVKREQPDIAIVSDIAKVDVIMKGQQYTYTYGNRGLPGDSYDYQVSFSDKNTPLYKRPVNPSDIAYINKDGNNSEDLEVYVTYHVRVKNQSTTLIMEAQEIVNYYDENYTLVDENWSNTSKNGEQYSTNGFKAAYTQQLRSKKIGPGQSSDIIEIRFKVNNNVVKDLIQKDALFKNVSEIYMYSTYYGSETMCAEHELAKTKGMTEKQSAGIDRDSAPGNTEIKITQDNVLDTTTYEDDTDIAPTFMLVKDDQYKQISGIVFEDTDVDGENNKDNERVGDGANNGEKGVDNVKVELLKVKDDGTTELADLYYVENNQAKTIPAVTYTKNGGQYQFGNNDEENGIKSGCVVDNYILKYTYGNDTTEITSGATTIDGGATQINARNYKSTIVKDSVIQPIMKTSYNGGQIETKDLLWHLTKAENTSIAVDNIDNLQWGGYNASNTPITVNAESASDKITEGGRFNTDYDKNARLTIPDLMNSNFYEPVNVSAYSLPFKVQIEYTQEQISAVDQNGGNFEHNWNRFNFGIIERAQENIVVDKTIDKLKITLANGQVLTEGSPYNETMNYVRALGQKEVFTRDDYTASMRKEKEIYMEMDSELIQGATLEILYKITVSNNSEIDYEYDQTLGGNEKYYYYGEVNSSQIKQSVEYLVDYVDSDLTCEVGANTQNVNWQKIDAQTLKDAGNISQEVLDRVNPTSGNYLIFVTNKFKNIAAGERHSETLYVSKLLANQADEHVYENHTEIIQLNGRIARTIDSTTKGTQNAKTYIPGNYIPSTKMLAEVEEPDLSRKHEQDDHSITLTITPPTGTENNIMIYVIAGTVALVAIGAGIYVIKRKIIK